MIIKIVMWIVVAIALTGAFLNTRSKWQGFLLWLVSNAWWCGYNIVAGEYPQAFLFGVFWILSLYGIFEWRKIHQWHLTSINKAIVESTAFAHKQLTQQFRINTYLQNVISSLPFHRKQKRKIREKLLKIQKGERL